MAQGFRNAAAHLCVYWFEEFHCDFVGLLVGSAGSLEVQGFCLYLDLWLVAVFHTNSQENQVVALGPGHEGRPTKENG